KVVGVRRPFFLPREVISLTVSEEFHSVLKTLRFWCRSHCSKRCSCVDLPEPSTPSTAMSLPAAASHARSILLILVLPLGLVPARRRLDAPFAAGLVCAIKYSPSELQWSQPALLDDRVIYVHLEVLPDRRDRAGEELLGVGAAYRDLHLHSPPGGRRARYREARIHHLEQLEEPVGRGEPLDDPLVLPPEGRAELLREDVRVA